MYIDIDKDNKFSIHDITVSEALSIATILMNTPLCNCPVINKLGRQMLEKAYDVLEQEEKQG